MNPIIDNEQLLKMVEDRLYSYEPHLDYNTTERCLSCITTLRQALIWEGKMCAPKKPKL